MPTLLRHGPSWWTDRQRSRRTKTRNRASSAAAFPIVTAVVGAYAHEIESGEPARAVDALLVARQIDAAIGAYPIAIA
jgi:hypothetical protein